MHLQQNVGNGGDEEALYRVDAQVHVNEKREREEVIVN